MGRSVTAGRRLAAWVVLAALLVGCELSVTSQLEVARDGSGTVGVTFAMDPAMLAELDAVDLDPTAELTAAVAGTPGWELERTADEQGLRVTATTTGDDPEELTAALGELTDGLSDDDPAVDLDLDLAVDDEGAAQLRGTAQLRAPAGPGVVDRAGDGVDTAADGAVTTDEMVELTREHVDATLVVTLPGRPLTHDADAVDGRTLTWQLPVGEPVAVQVDAGVPSPWTPQLLLAIGAGILLLVSAAAAGWAWRRRR